MPRAEVTVAPLATGERLVMVEPPATVVAAMVAAPAPEAAAAVR